MMWPVRGGGVHDSSTVGASSTLSTPCTVLANKGDQGAASGTAWYVPRVRPVTSALPARSHARNGLGAPLGGAQWHSVAQLISARTANSSASRTQGVTARPITARQTASTGGGGAPGARASDSPALLLPVEQPD
ncbi:uncharacterized protein BP5553_02144 [Venustampulla echinocandica]|uniref:Uncharacterized protein n=1 Tax=Venustampulla echinocandica TaxID=2656787 RepID=A0A370U317_9HELO|nr:uncharacterized protein BP5553_02144 [Venustampulla echinocandica]RDL42165.1 hypothetical protein BP5553_02144 [Venustampulla echinocandica]